MGFWRAQRACSRIKNMPKGVGGSFVFKVRSAACTYCPKYDTGYDHGMTGNGADMLEEQLTNDGRSTGAEAGKVGTGGNCLLGFWILMLCPSAGSNWHGADYKHRPA